GIKNEVMPEAHRTATRAVSGFESYDQRTKVVQRGEDPYEPMPVVKGVPIGNGCTCLERGYLHENRSSIGVKSYAWKMTPQTRVRCDVGKVKI
ncbi:hypothetical protein Dimus_036393, partial [Dionaea muscipula]